MTRKSSGEFYAQMQAETSNPRGDIWWGGTGDPHMQAAEEGLTIQYESPNLTRMMNGSSSTSTRTSLKQTISRPRTPRSSLRWWIFGGRRQGSIMYCRLMTAFASARHQCRPLPRFAQALRVPCRDGAPADRGGTRRAQPQLSDRGRRSHRRCARRCPDRAWRCDNRLQPVCPVWLPGARHEYRRGACDREIAEAGTARRAPARRTRASSDARGAVDHGHRPGTPRVHAIDRWHTGGPHRVAARLFNFISWTGLDIGRDRGSPVSHYEAPSNSPAGSSR
jgi:hypothetical protein